MARLDMWSAHFTATAAALQLCLLLAAPSVLHAQVVPPDSFFVPPDSFFVPPDPPFVPPDSPFLPLDSLALVELYHSTGGPGWFRDDNWLEGPVNTWYGITTASTRVTHIELGENGLLGSIPPGIGMLTAMEVLDLHGNQLSGSIPRDVGLLFALRELLLHENALDREVPVELTRLGELGRLWLFDNAIDDLPGLSNMASLFDLQVQRNRLTFEDIEPNVGVAEVFIYAPQANIGEASTQNIAAGGNFMLSYSVGGANNAYQWIHDGVPISGATDSSYSVTNASGAEEGIYRLQIRNGIATQLTLVSEPVTLSIQASDLIVSSLSHAPADPTSDDVITFTAVVENRGDVTAASSTLAFALTGSETPALVDVPELAPGADHEAVHRSQLDAGQEYAYTATADAHRNVVESDETNNVAEGGLFVTLPQRTLTVASQNPNSGVPIAVDTDVEGDGQGTTPFFRRYEDGTRVTLTAPGSAERSTFLQWRLDGASWSSNPTETVTMDSDHTVTAVYASQPDLEVTSLTHTPEQPTSDDLIAFTAVVENRGDVTAASSTLAFTLTGSETPALVDVPELAPGADYEAVHRAELTAGEHVYTATADVHDRVDELDETNNVAEGGLFVTAPEDPLRILLVVTPERVAPLDWGESTTFTVTVEDEQGERLGEARVRVEDGVQGRIVDAGRTDAEGVLSYDATVPEGAPEGTFDLAFRAMRQGYMPSDPVVRQVRVERRVPVLSTSLEIVDFGETFVGARSERSLTVSNTGRAELVVTPEITGARADAFAILSGGAPFALSPSAAAREIVVRFAPREAALHDAVLLLRTNAGDKQIVLQGTGRAPCISSPNGDDEPAADVQHRVQIAVCEDFKATHAELFYRRGGETGYQSMELTGSGLDYAASIPADFVTERGIDYYVQVRAGEFTTTFPPNASADDPAHVSVRVPQSALRPTRPHAYRMVSVPFELTDASIDGVFGDDYGASDRSRWRVLRWQPRDDRYAEHPAIDETVRPGVAFWLITRDGEPFDVEEAVSMDASEAFVFTLEPGWNQIGNPFAFPVAWSDVDGREGMEGPWSYDAVLEDFEACCAPVLQPWEGYFVFNGTGNLAELHVPPIESMPSQESVPSMLSGAGYSVQLVAERVGGGSRDAHNVVGLATEAAGAADRLNLREAPGVGDIRLSILDRGERMAASFKPLGGAGQQWDVEIAASTGNDAGQAPARVRITLLERGVRPEGFQIYVLDLDRARRVDAAQQGFELTLDEGSAGRDLRVIVGTEAFAGDRAGGVSLTPLAFELEQNYPNPFHPETVIRYRLPERLHTVLEVYDALGRRVRSLVDVVQEPGAHEIRWDGLDGGGRQAASGVYVARLRAGSHSASIRMSLVR